MTPLKQLVLLMVILPLALQSQNVGINTANPLYRLDVDAITGASGNPVRLQGLLAGSISDSIISSNSGILRRLSISQIVGSGAWATTGNSSMTSGTNFLGHTDAVDLVFKTNNTEKLRILSSGNVGIGTTTPVNLLDIDGKAVIGASYGGTNTAPTNGLLIQGNVGIGTTTANVGVDVNGSFSPRPTTISLTADDQVITVGNSSALILNSNNSSATSRTFTLSNGLQNGQVLYVIVATNSAEVKDPPNCHLNSNYQMTVGKTLTLFWYSPTWYEIGRN